MYEPQPRIRIEIEGLKQSVIHQFSTLNSEIDARVKGILTEKLSEEWVIYEIEEAVTECIRQAIRSLSKNYELQELIKQAAIDSISKTIKEVKTNE